MKKIFVVVFLLSLVGVVRADTYYYTNSNGMPAGSSQRMGNTTYYTNSNGMPAGSSQRMGNTVYHYDSNGMPAGTTTRLW